LLYCTNVSNTTRQALKWNPQGKRKRGRPRNSWRRDLESEVISMGRTWEQLERLAQDREAWRILVGGLCPIEGRQAFKSSKSSLIVQSIGAKKNMSIVHF